MDVSILLTKCRSRPNQYALAFNLLIVSVPAIIR